MLRPRWLAAPHAVLLAFSCLCVGVRQAGSAPLEYISLDDPILEELRILEVLDPGRAKGRFLLPRFNTQPLQWVEIQGDTTPPADPSAAYAITLARLERATGRNAAVWFSPHPQYRSTPRLYARVEDGQRFELATGATGTWEGDENRGRLLSGSGSDSRVGLGLDRWLAFTRVIIGQYDSASTFADPIVSDIDVLAMTEETYISYTGERQRWAMQFGQNRWHWGPGHEGSLVISKTSPSLTGLAMRAHLSSLRLDLIALSATLEQASEEQLAAHRIEWQPHPALRLGVTESARYEWPGWQPLYALGAIPYVIVQRLLQQKEPDSLRAHRNNILTAFDASWRVAPGTRVYGEFLIDDLQAESKKNPNKYAFQLGYEGAAAFGRGRLSWGGEYTRVTRYVYTSFFGRAYVVEGQSTGFPYSPDSRRLRVRAAWDPSPDWQWTLHAVHSDKGENDLDEPFTPGSGRQNSSSFEGTVETTREIVMGARWWPASGVDLRIEAGYRWIEQPQHVPGADDQTPIGTITVRLMR